MNKAELEFAIFCIESVAELVGMHGKEVYKIMTSGCEINVLDDYIIPCYDSLHTQGKAYIVRELLEVMREKGGKI
jgi:hypothetical protein